MNETSHAHLLIVDDSAAQTEALCRTLKMHGYEPIGVHSAAEALRALRRESFDVVITDLQMPDMDGIALLRSAAALDTSTVGIVMTGHGGIDTAIDALRNGALDYILKPFNLNAILPAIERAIAVRRLRLANAMLLERVGERTVALEQANRRLEESNRQLHSIAHSFSRDLRMPVRVIEKLVQALRAGDPTRISPELGDLLTAAAASAQRIEEMIVNLDCLRQRDARSEVPPE